MSFEKVHLYVEKYSRRYGEILLDFLSEKEFLYFRSNGQIESNMHLSSEEHEPTMLLIHNFEAPNTNIREGGMITTDMRRLIEITNEARETDTDTNIIQNIVLENDYCIVPEKFRNNISRALSKWYKKVAMPILWGRVEYFSNLMQVEPKNFRLSNAKGCWGSCNSQGLVSLNWRLIMVPHNLIDYVVVHELSHLLQMNHSQLFWKVVSSVLPDFRVRRQNLKKGDYLLSLFRE